MSKAQSNRGIQTAGTLAHVEPTISLPLNSTKAVMHDW